MGVESVSKISDLNELWPDEEDGSGGGDDHIRNLKVAVKSLITDVNQIGIGPASLSGQAGKVLAVNAAETGFTDLVALTATGFSGIFVYTDIIVPSTYVKGAGVTALLVIVIGAGGGGGGGGTAPTAYPASGGGGGGAAVVRVDATGITTALVTVGTNGAGGAVGVDGSDGGDSSFGSHAIASGGKGGKAGISVPLSGGEGGTILTGNFGVVGGSGFPTDYPDSVGGRGGNSFLGCAKAVAAGGEGYGGWGSGGQGGNVDGIGGTGQRGIVVVLEFKG